jgi:hypothetical protein
MVRLSALSLVVAQFSKREGREDTRSARARERKKVASE